MSKLIIANWKMNPSSLEEAVRLVKGVLAGGLPKDIELVIAPPFIYLDAVKKLIGKEVKLCAQDLAWAERGAYTGEISGLMLKNLGCEYVIIGHCERRYKIGETEEMINLKLKAAFSVGLKPILAVGEKEQGEDIIKTLSDQLKNALNGIEAGNLGRLVVAYEPVWAIGTGMSDTPDHALSSALLIRKIITGIYSSDWASDLPVLYGGSVTAENADEYISQTGINGALVGGASLEVENFLKIIKSAQFNG
ncbi:MAG: triose-phosphate isomerase [Candidatus Azambacteria bacterium]|nr:triose-phosphate isomerase [Candidatus Azambacteria bacterium]